MGKRIGVRLALALVMVTGCALRVEQLEPEGKGVMAIEGDGDTITFEGLESGREDIFALDPKLSPSLRSPAEAGIVRFEPGEAVPTVPSSRKAKLLAQLENPEPVPIVVHLLAFINDPSLPIQDVALLLGATQLNVDGINYAGVVLEGGDQSGRHRTLADFRSGMYQLPACTYVRVSAFMWNTTGAVDTVPYVFQCGLSRGLATQPKTLTLSGWGRMEAGDSVQVSPNSYARLFDVWATNWNGGKCGVGQPGAPIIRTSNAIERDYTTGLFTPPWGPVEASTNFATDTDNGGVSIYNDGPDAVDVHFKYWLEI